MKQTKRRGTALLLAVLLAAAALPAGWAALEEAGTSSFTLNTRAGETLVFSPEDFTSRLSSDVELDGILITALPDGETGKLVYGTRELLEGEAVAVESLGALKFVPTGKEASAATFDFLPVYAEGVGMDSVTVAVQMSATQNMAPTAVAAEGRTYKNVAVELRLSGEDPEGDTLTFALTGKPVRGEAALEATTGVLTYTPYHDKTGEDVFTFTVTDSAGNTSEPAEIRVNIDKSAAAHTYTDLQEDGTHYAALRLWEEGIFVGEQIGEESFFHPDTPVTRGEFLAMALKALSSQEVTPVLKTGFADDEETPAWVRPYASAALKAGIVQGSAGSDGALRLLSDSVITRAEAAVMMSKAMELPDTDISAAVFSGTETASWAIQSAVNLQQAGVLSTAAGPLSQPLTRAEAAKLLVAAMDEQQQEKPKKWFFGLF